MSYYGGGGDDDWTGSSSGPPQGPFFDQKGMLGGKRLATPLQRITAALIDWLPAAAAIQLFRAIPTGTKTEQVCNQLLGCYATREVETHHLAFIGWLLALAWIGYTQVWLQSIAGQSLGKRVLDLQVVWPLSTEPGNFVPILPGRGRLAARAAIDLAQGFFCFAPSLIMVFATFYRQTLGDKLTQTTVLGPNHGLELEAGAPPRATPVL